MYKKSKNFFFIKYKKSRCQTVLKFFQTHSEFALRDPIQKLRDRQNAARDLSISGRVCLQRFISQRLFLK